MSETVIVHEVGFNKEWVANLNLTKFRSHPSNTHLWPELTAAEKRERLKCVHELCKTEPDGNDSGDAKEGESAEPSEGISGDNKTDETGDSEAPATAIV